MIFFVWTIPVFNEIKSLNLREGSFNSVLAKSKELQATKDKLLSEYNSVNENDINRLDKILPPKEQSTRIFIEINNIAKRYGLVLKDINAQKLKGNLNASFGKKEKKFDKSILRMTLIGPYASFVSFLGDLEKNLTLIDVNQIDFNVGDSDSYEFNIDALTYWKE